MLPVTLADLQVDLYRCRPARRYEGQNVFLKAIHHQRDLPPCMHDYPK